MHLLLLQTHLFTHTHTCIQQVQADSAQYLGGYSGEGGALRDVFGYLQSLYPQGSKHQLLLGRTHWEGRISVVREERLQPKNDRVRGKHMKFELICHLHFMHQ